MTREIEITLTTPAGETYHIARDSATQHPAAVHEALGTSSEAELQEHLDQIRAADYYQGGQHLGPDIDGLSVRYLDDGQEVEASDSDGRRYVAKIEGPGLALGDPR